MIVLGWTPPRWIVVALTLLAAMTCGCEEPHVPWQGFRFDGDLEVWCRGDVVVEPHDYVFTEHLSGSPDSPLGSPARSIGVKDDAEEAGALMNEHWTLSVLSADAERKFEAGNLVGFEALVGAISSLGGSAVAECVRAQSADRRFKEGHIWRCLDGTPGKELAIKRGLSGTLVPPEE